jgi:hypothetical protein
MVGRLYVTAYRTSSWKVVSLALLPDDSSPLKWCISYRSTVPSSTGLV